MLPRLVMAEDEEISAALEREMKKQKIALHLGTKVEDRKDNADGSITLTLTGGKTVDVDTVLVATGRRPVQRRPRARPRSASPRRARPDRGGRPPAHDACTNIYAIGDVTDIKQLAHFASAQGKAAVEIIAGHAAQTNWRAVPAATFTTPEIASVGLTETRGEGRGPHRQDRPLPVPRARPQHRRRRDDRVREDRRATPAPARCWARTSSAPRRAS